MTRRRPSRAELELWRLANLETQPLPERELPPAPPSEESGAEAAPAPPKALSPVPSPAPAPRRQTAPLAHGLTVDMDKRTAQRMRRGRMEIEARIDLHGMTQDSAHAALRGFLAGAWERGRRCVLVITGKGGRQGTGVLRAQVPRWLNEADLRPRVLAFSYAQPEHGGEGALYVLLKRRR